MKKTVCLWIAVVLLFGCAKELEFQDLNANRRQKTDENVDTSKTSVDPKPELPPDPPQDEDPRLASEEEIADLRNPKDSQYMGIEYLEKFYKEAYQKNLSKGDIKKYTKGFQNQYSRTQAIILLEKWLGKDLTAQESSIAQKLMWELYQKKNNG